MTWYSIFSVEFLFLLKDILGIADIKIKFDRGWFFKRKMEDCGICSRAVVGEISCKEQLAGNYLKFGL